MGTTADKLQAVLNSKNAIRDKFNLGDIPFSQYADNIKIAEGGGNNEASGETCAFYQCVSIDHNAGYYPVRYDLWMTRGYGGGAGSFETEFKLVSAEVMSSLHCVWRTGGDVDYSTISFNFEKRRWEYIHTWVDGLGNEGTTLFAYREGAENETHPSVWGKWTTAYSEDDYIYYASKGNEYPSTEYPGLWTGKLITRNTEGYFISNESVSNLTYPLSQTPGIGGIYNADATIDVSWMFPDIDAPGASYYCTYVNRTYSTYEFTVSGLPDDLFKDLADWEGNLYPEKYRTKNPNGTYAPYYQEGELSGWKFKNEHGTVCYWNGEWMAWVFAPFAPGETDYWLSSFPVRGRCEWENMRYPWDPTIEWVDGNTDSPISGLSVASVIQPPVEQYWNGYKLVQNESGKYDIDYSEEYKLTYADFMPVAGRFYDGACTTEIHNLTLDKKSLFACPFDMTSHDSKEWAITSWSPPDKWDGKECPAWHAFDANKTIGDGGTVFYSYNYVTYVRWANKNHPVILRKLSVTNNSQGSDAIASFEGSNDGIVWHRLNPTSTTEKHETGDIYTYTKVYGNNTTPYRIYRLEVPGSMIHHVEAYITENTHDVPDTLEKTEVRTPLFFHAPLNEETSKLLNDTDIYSEGTVTYGEYDGRKGVYLNPGRLYGGNVSAWAPVDDEPFTAGVWVKADSSAPDRVRVLQFGTNSSDLKEKNFRMELRNGTLYVVSSSAEDDQCGSANRSFDASSWHHLVVCHEYGKDYFYIDGAPAGVFEVKRTLGGKRTNYSSYWHMGDNSVPIYLSEAQIYNIYLSAEKVAEWYADDGKVIDFE